ncbi:transglutaminase family protein [Chachezhania sediminis]|uniref:transglutaminase family protein n=1 Tax=Chachezhania sediminis TaxID=2599291 RepID=UPI00131C4E7C|nr:transglutaminase family protein [Chachezhania sediminis]
MPRIEIRHRTAYRYGAAVTLRTHRMMLRPRETRDLRLIAFDLDISPAAEVVWSHDVAGNAVATATFAYPTDTLVIQSRMIVDLTAPTWPVFSIAASATEFPFRYSSDDLADLGLLTLPQYADVAGRLARWADGFILSRPTDTLSLLKDIANGVSSAVYYQSRETEGTQGPLETLDRGWGSCRDFAVLFTEAVRTLGFGARLVSGYLYDPNSSHLGSAGSGSTHAWAEVFVPGAGWIPFDPTNRSVGSANLVPVAVARRIEQAAPVTGSYFGTDGGLHEMDVVVDVSS